MTKVRLLEALEGIVARAGGLPLLQMLVIFSLIGIGIGFYLTKNPLSAIELQKKFYSRINWRMEPIDLPKEIRNTRLMGIFIILFLLVSLLIIIRTRLL